MKEHVKELMETLKGIGQGDSMYIHKPGSVNLRSWQRQMKQVRAELEKHNIFFRCEWLDTSVRVIRQTEPDGYCKLVYQVGKTPEVVICKKSLKSICLATQTRLERSTNYRLGKFQIIPVR